MGENLKIKRIEVDEFKQITAIEFEEGAYAYDVVEFCTKFGIARFNPRVTVSSGATINVNGEPYKGIGEQ